MYYREVMIFTDITFRLANTLVYMPLKVNKILSVVIHFVWLINPFIFPKLWGQLYNSVTIYGGNMAVNKYGHLIKPFSQHRIDKAKPKKGKEKVFFNVPQYDEQSVGFSGKDLEGINLSLNYKFKTKLGDWHNGRDPHVHPYPEVQFYVGLDTANVNYLGAEVDVCLGKEQETYTFAEPTVIVIPAGVPHGPAITKRIYSPKGYGFYTAILAADSKPQWLNDSHPAPSKGKYAKLVKPLKSAIVTERGKLNPNRFAGQKSAFASSAPSGFQLGPGNADHLAWFYGKELDGLNVNMDWGFFSKPGLWHRGAGAHSHPVDEVLVFAGVNPADMNYLGAEIEIDLGKEHERHIIDKPSVVVVPAGTPHCPIVSRWVDKPFAFFSVNLSAAPETTYID